VTYYYVALETKSHAFLLEQRLRIANVQSELTYMPRDIMTDLCNMGVKLPETELYRGIDVIRRCGLPGCTIYREDISPTGYDYEKVCI